MTTQEILKEMKNSKNRKKVFMGERNKNVFEVSYSNILHWNEEAQKSERKMTYVVNGWNSGVTKFYFDESDFLNRLERLLKKHKNVKLYPEHTSYWEIWDSNNQFLEI